MADILILGYGPAGISAALYGLRAGLDVLIVGKDVGALARAHMIENYYGLEKPLSGPELAEVGKKQALALGAKIVDDDYRKYGVRREGIINSLGGVMNRLNGLYTSLAFYVASSVFGFVNGDDPGPNPGFAARVLLCIFPCAAMVIASVITFFLHFPADEKKEEADG